MALLAILVAGVLAWTAWARLAPARPLVAVAIFDNETGDAAFDRLALTAADIMVERLTALGSERVGIIGNTPALRVPREQRSPGRSAARPGPATSSSARSRTMTRVCAWSSI